MKIGTGMTLLVGGARSGKSDLAVKLGLGWDGTVVFAATAEPIDDDMAARIDRHRLDRPDRWATVEHPTFGADQLSEVPDEALLILDCVTLLVSNLMYVNRPEADPAIDADVGDEGPEPVAEHMTRLAEALAGRAGPTVVVSNEVGMGVHPETELGRAYRDQLGTANRIMAESCDDVLLIMAGRALPLEPVHW